MNPTDNGTRGMTLETLKASAWLRRPGRISESKKNLRDKCVKNSLRRFNSAFEETCLGSYWVRTSIWMDKFNYFGKLIHVFFCCLNWKVMESELNLTMEKLITTIRTVLKCCQRESFHDSYEKISEC